MWHEQKSILGLSVDIHCTCFCPGKRNFHLARWHLWSLEFFNEVNFNWPGCITSYVRDLKRGLKLTSPWPNFYRPQTKFAKVMFLHVSVILSTGGWGWGCLVPGGCLVLGGTWSRGLPAPRGACSGGVEIPPWRLLLRAVRILLECILVNHWFTRNETYHLKNTWD